MFKKIIFPFLFLCCFSCAIDQQIYFNEDFSGNFNLKVDLTEMIDFSEGMSKDLGDTTEVNEEKESSPEEKALYLKGFMDGFSEKFSFVEQLEMVPGLSNVSEQAEGKVMLYHFDFNSAEALNQALFKIFSSVDDSEKPAVNNDFKYFSTKRNGMVYKEPKPIKKKEEESEAEPAEEDDKMTSEMASQIFDFNYTMKFEREIAAVKGKNIEQIDAHTLKFINYIDEENKIKGLNDFVVKFKK